ncbi:MAG: chorismate mutase [Acidobacteriota bacterium]
MRGPASRSPSPQDLFLLRSEIERIDRALVALIAERMRITLAAGDVKRASGQEVIDLAREAEVVRRSAELAREMSLDEEEVRHIFWCLIGLSRRAQLERA